MGRRRDRYYVFPPHTRRSKEIVARRWESGWLVTLAAVARLGKAKYGERFALLSSGFPWQPLVVPAQMTSVTRAHRSTLKTHDHPKKAFMTGVIKLAENSSLAAPQPVGVNDKKRRQCLFQ